MVILGIDPGLAHTGWGIIEERRGEVRCRAYGCIETSAGSPLAVRLSHIARDLKGVVERYRPDTAAIESIYFGANVRSAIPTAHARGAARDAELKAHARHIDDGQAHRGLDKRSMELGDHQYPVPLC